MENLSSWGKETEMAEGRSWASQRVLSYAVMDRVALVHPWESPLFIIVAGAAAVGSPFVSHQDLLCLFFRVSWFLQAPKVISV